MSHIDLGTPFEQYLLRLRNAGYKEVFYINVEVGDVLTNGKTLFREVLEITKKPYTDRLPIKEMIVCDNKEDYDVVPGSVKPGDVVKVLK